ncbi:uncharacterized protein LOC120348287 [Styela clava]|uniref:uncharacterized protein LOC120348287 n=1 Tax=Styela clava TaxID=7725 RepID=UPI00193A5443|nr:uncharacterized protein LOC120348287 [Styela clava]
MMASLANTVFMACFMANVCLGQLCGENVSYEPLDIIKISEVMHDWYDVIDIIPSKNRFDYCHDIRNFNKVDDGFILTMTLQVEGRATEDSLDSLIHYIDNGDGTYTANPELIPSMAASSRESFKHKLNVTGLQKVEAMIYKMSTGNFFFLTDYDEYFIMAKCAPDSNLIALVKHKKKQPTGKDVADIWNVFSNHGEAPITHWEGFCTRRRFTKYEIEEK